MGLLIRVFCHFLSSLESDVLYSTIQMWLQVKMDNFDQLFMFSSLTNMKDYIKNLSCSVMFAVVVNPYLCSFRPESLFSREVLGKFVLFTRSTSRLFLPNESSESGKIPSYIGVTEYNNRIASRLK